MTLLNGDLPRLLHERIRTLPAPLDTTAGLAAHLGVDTGSVVDWRAGRAVPDADVLVRLLRLVDPERTFR